DRVLSALRGHRGCEPARHGAAPGEGAGALLRGLLQRGRVRAVPDLPGPPPRRRRALRGGGAQGRGRDRAHRRVPREVPRPRWSDQPAGGDRPGSAPHPGVDGAALHRGGQGVDPRHRPEHRGRGDRHLSGVDGQAHGPDRDPPRQWTAGRRRPGVRRRDHPGPRLRGPPDGVTGRRAEITTRRSANTVPRVGHSSIPTQFEPLSRQPRPKLTSPQPIHVTGDIEVTLMRVPPLQRLVALAAAATLVLTACGDGGDNGEQPEDQGALPLVVGTTDSVTNVDPAGEFDHPSNNIVDSLYQKLLRIPPGETDPVPDAAESCEFTDDVTYTCTLKEGLQFSDGEPVTAEDVVFSFQRQVTI